MSLNSFYKPNSPEQFFLRDHPALESVIHLASKPDAITLDGWMSVPSLNSNAAKAIGGYIHLLNIAKQAVIIDESLLPRKINEDIARTFAMAFPGEGVGEDARLAAQAVLGGMAFSYAYSEDIPPIVGEKFEMSKRRKAVYLSDLLHLDSSLLPRSLGSGYLHRGYENVSIFLQDRERELMKVVFQELQKNPHNKAQSYKNAARTYLNILLYITDSIFSNTRSLPSPNFAAF